MEKNSKEFDHALSRAILYLIRKEFSEKAFEVTVDQNNETIIYFDSFTSEANKNKFMESIIKYELNSYVVERSSAGGLSLRVSLIDSDIVQRIRDQTLDRNFFVKGEPSAPNNVKPPRKPPKKHRQTNEFARGQKLKKTKSTFFMTEKEQTQSIVKATPKPVKEKKPHLFLSKKNPKMTISKLLGGIFSSEKNTGAPRLDSFSYKYYENGILGIDFSNTQIALLSYKALVWYLGNCVSMDKSDDKVVLVDTSKMDQKPNRGLRHFCLPPIYGLCSVDDLREKIFRACHYKRFGLFYEKATCQFILEVSKERIGNLDLIYSMLSEMDWPMKKYPNSPRKIFIMTKETDASSLEDSLAEAGNTSLVEIAAEEVSPVKAVTLQVMEKAVSLAHDQDEELFTSKEEALTSLYDMYLKKEMFQRLTSETKRFVLVFLRERLKTEDPEKFAQLALNYLNSQK